VVCWEVKRLLGFGVSPREGAGDGELGKLIIWESSKLCIGEKCSPWFLEDEVGDDIAEANQARQFEWLGTGTTLFSPLSCMSSTLSQLTFLICSTSCKVTRLPHRRRKPHSSSRDSKQCASEISSLQRRLNNSPQANLVLYYSGDEYAQNVEFIGISRLYLLNT
jgi:hypothetical protein